MLKDLLTKDQIIKDIKEFTKYIGMGGQPRIQIHMENQPSTIKQGFTKSQLWDIREYQVRRYNELFAAGELPSQEETI